MFVVENSYLQLQETLNLKAHTQGKVPLSLKEKIMQFLTEQQFPLKSESNSGPDIFQFMLILPHGIQNDNSVVAFKLLKKSKT